MSWRHFPAAYTFTVTKKNCERNIAAKMILVITSLRNKGIYIFQPLEHIRQVFYGDGIRPIAQGLFRVFVDLHENGVNTYCNCRPGEVAYKQIGSASCRE